MHYEYDVAEGLIVHSQTRELLDTKEGSPGAKWIFVMSTSKKLYAGEVRVEQHKTFLFCLTKFLYLNSLLLSETTNTLLIVSRKRKGFSIILASWLEEQQ